MLYTVRKQKYQKFRFSWRTSLLRSYCYTADLTIFCIALYLYWLLTTRQIQDSKIFFRWLPPPLCWSRLSIPHSLKSSGHSCKGRIVHFKLNRQRGQFRVSLFPLVHVSTFLSDRYFYKRQPVSSSDPDGPFYRSPGRSWQLSDRKNHIGWSYFKEFSQHFFPKSDGFSLSVHRDRDWRISWIADPVQFSVEALSLPLPVRCQMIWKRFDGWTT